MGHLAPAAAVLLAGLLAGCGQGGGTACPAIGWGRTIHVELTGDRAAGPVAEVQIECSPACPPLRLLDEQTGGPHRSVSAEDPLRRPVPFGAPVPESAGVTLLGADGAVLAEEAADLDWVRTGGSEECGGPMVASIVVPAS